MKSECEPMNYVAGPKDPRSVLDDSQVHRLYNEATAVMFFGRVGREDAAGWAHAMRLLDTAAVLRLVPTSHDPHPWVVFVQLLCGLRQVRDTADLRVAEAHLHELGQAVLDAQGCAMVRPEYLLGRPLPVVEAARRIHAL